MKESRTLNIIFSKRGDGKTLTPKISLPMKDLNRMGITPENREVEYIYDEENKQIIIRKK